MGLMHILSSASSLANSDIALVFNSLGLLLIGGLFTSIILEKIKIPHISSYVIGGIILGSSVLNLIPSTSQAVFGSITYFGLGLIAFVIGMEFHYSTLKGTGFKIPIITLFQVIITITFVALGFVIFGFGLKDSMIIGAIASATAPGPIIIIVKAFKIRKSKIKNTLLPVVALDDAFSVIAFALVMSFFGIASDSGNYSGIYTAIQEIFISIAFGAFIGAILGVFATIKKGYAEFLTFTLAATFFGLSFSLQQNGSTIITLMVAGIVFTNLIDKEKYIINEKSITKFTPPIFILFYTIAGLKLSINAFIGSIVLVVLYIVLRSIGKIIGCYWGCRIVGEEKIVTNNLGYAMLPQAGVAIGLTLTLPAEIKSKVLPIILGAVLFFELVGPLLVQYSFKKENQNLLKMNEEDPAYQFAIGKNYKQKSKRNIFVQALKNQNQNQKDNKESNNNDK